MEEVAIYKRLFARIFSRINVYDEVPFNIEPFGLKQGRTLFRRIFSVKNNI